MPTSRLRARDKGVLDQYYDQQDPDVANVLTVELLLADENGDQYKFNIRNGKIINFIKVVDQ